MSAPFLTFEGVSKWYGQVIGLNDVTVEVPPGITGLLGPNGAGKSTFLKLATGLVKARQGKVLLLGEDPWNNPPLMTRIGLAPEHDSFYEWMSGHDFVRLLLRASGLPESETFRRAREAMVRVGMQGAMHRPIGTYSKGMRQRTKIAQALAHDPEVIFLDEPMTGTDPLGRRDLIHLIRDLGRQGVHVLVSSHVLYEIEAMTNNILLIAKGRIVAEGDIHQIRSLIDEHPHRIHVEVDEPRRLAGALVAFPDVTNVGFQGAAVVAETRDPEAFYARLPEITAKLKLSIRSMHSPDDNLQAVFNYLVK